MQLVILAAGRGSRLHPLTLQRSKAMIPVLGKPMVARVLETLEQGMQLAAEPAHGGSHPTIMVVSNQDSEIRAYFSTRCPSTQQANSDQSLESCQESVVPLLPPAFVVQPERLGMGNALQCAADLITQSFVLSACDNLTAAQHVRDLIQAHHQLQSMATLSLMEVDGDSISRTGIVQMEGDRVVRIVEKPKPSEAPSNIASLPLYVFSPQFLPYLTHIKKSVRGEYELQDAIQLAIEDGARVCGVQTSARRQLTNAADLLELNLHFLAAGSEPLRLEPALVGDQTHLVAPVYIEASTRIGEGCVIGPNVYIEHGCTIGAHTQIRNAVLLRNGIIEDGQTVIDQVVAGE